MRRSLLLIVLAGCPEARPVKRSQAEAHLDHIANAATNYAVKHGAFPIGTSAQLPTPPSDARSPAAGCCGGANSGTGLENKCPVSSAWTSDPIWQTLGVTIDEPSLYRYRYESTDGKAYTVVAEGDLDCDGVTAAWTLKGTHEPSEKGRPSKGMTMIARPPKGEY